MNWRREITICRVEGRERAKERIDGHVIPAAATGQITQMNDKIESRTFKFMQQRREKLIR
jgi:hypothetical protein